MRYPFQREEPTTLPAMVLVCASSTLSLTNVVPFTSQISTTTPFASSFLFNNRVTNVSVFVCHAKKKIGFFDRILDYIEGGPKLRKWYGAPGLFEKDGTSTSDDASEDYPEDEVRDAVLVTDGDSEMGQMVILSLIVNKSRVKALVKDKRVALEAFGNYIESMVGDTGDSQFLKKALRGVSTIICPNEGFISSVGSLQGVKHVILLSQLSVYSGKIGIQSMMKSNAKKLAEQDESVLSSSGIPYTIIRTAELQDTPGGKQGFTFDKGCAASGSISKEDAAFVCVKALEFVPQTGFIFEVANGENKVSDWKECLAALMEKSSQQPLQ